MDKSEQKKPNAKSAARFFRRGSKSGTTHSSHTSQTSGLPVNELFCAHSQSIT